MLQKRTNILFDLETWKMLSSLAKRENKSVGELTRQAVKKVYIEKNIEEERREAIEWREKIKTGIKSITYGEIRELINAGRKY